jgi:perosamine synthetase
VIPVYEPDLSGNEEVYLLDAFRSGWISSKGSYVDRFEKEFAQFIGSSSQGIAVSNGTVALHLALLALDVGPEHDVLVPDFTYVACANAVAYTGANPIFFGSDVDDIQASLESARQSVTKNTRALILSHLYGAPADVIGFRKLADELNIFLIEDCAEAIGTYVDGRHAGSWGDVTTFSFFGNKTLTTGEGGMVFARETAIEESIRKYKNQGLSAPGSYHHDRIGYNYRMTNLQAAIGVAQLERADEIIKRKRDNHATYVENLGSHAGLRLLEPTRGISSYWMETLLIDLGISSQEIIEKLKLHGVESRPGFTEMTSLPMYTDSQVGPPGTKKRGSQIINLPSSPLLTKQDIEYVTEKLLEICHLR